MSYLIGHAPHLRGKESPPALMYRTLAALIPAALGGIYFFGLRALVVMLTCVGVSVFTEYVMQKLLKKEVSIFDGSALLTGLLLSLTVTPRLPWYAAALGAVFAIAIGKQLFGGLGYNIFNPALIGRAFLAAAFPVAMTSFQQVGVDAVTSATPLVLFKFQNQSTPLLTLFLGNVSGSIGETSTLLILLGGLYLIIRGIIDWRIPVGYLGTAAILAMIFKQSPFFHLFSGGLMFGAFFMATDLVTTPVTKKGIWIFAVGAGILVMVIRLFSGQSEGVMYSILIMNAFVPLLNRYTRPRIFGRKK